MRASHLHRRSLLARAARTAGRVLLGAVGALAFLVGVTLSFLRTERGGRFVKEQALPRLNAELAGSIGLRHFSFKGNGVVLDDVLIKEPEGAVVAHVALVRVAFAPLALLRGQVVLHEVAIASPTLTLRQDARGLDLARALAPRKPASSSFAPPSRDKGGGGLGVSVERFLLTDGTVDFVSVVPGAERHVGARGLTVEGAGHLASGGQSFAANLALGGELVAPLSTPLALSLGGHGRGDEREAALQLSLGAHGAVALRASTSADGAATLRISELEVAPSLVRAFAPEVGLGSRVRASGEATLRGAALGVDAVVRAGGGAVTARGTFDLAARRARSFAVRGTDLDLGAVIEGLPRSKLGFALDGAGGGRDLATATGHLRLTAPRGRLGGRPVGPLDLALSADGTRLRLERLAGEALGLRFSGQGALAQSALVAPPSTKDGATGGSGLRGRDGDASLHLTLEAEDLHACERAMLQERAATLPLISGRGQLDLTLQGRAEGPRLSLAGRFPRLAIDDKRLRELRFAATVPDLGLPTVFSADVGLAGAALGERTLRGLAVHAASSGSRLDAELRLAGPGPTVISLGGRWASDHRAFTLETFALRSPEATWQAARPIAVTFRPEELAIKGVDLRAGSQRVRAELSKRGELLDATLAISGFDLARLPRAFVPASANLGGRLDVDARARGRLPAPVVDAQVRLAGGSVQRLRELSLALDAHYGRGRASGQISAHGLSTTLEGRFDVPATWPFAPSAPLAVDLTLAETKLGEVAKVLGQRPLPVDGLTTASLHLEGRAGAPEGRLVVGLRKLTARGEELGDVTAELGSPPRGPLRLALLLALRDPRARGPAQASPPGQLTLTTPRTLGQVLASPPSPDALARWPLEVAADLPQVPLALLNAFLAQPLFGADRSGGESSRAGGSASLRLHAQGPASALEGALNVQVQGAEGPKFPATDGRLDLSFGSDVRVALQVARQEKVLAWLSGGLALPTARLADEKALAAARLQVKAGLGPVALRHLGTPQLASAHPPPTLDARAVVNASLEGTLRAPTLAVDANVRDARFGGAPVGEAEAHLRYASRKLSAVVAIRSPTGGRFDLRGSADADLGYPFEATRLAPRAIPFDAHATAAGFDLAWLSGLSPAVQQIAGTLVADIRAHGSFGDPVVAGNLAWSKGRLVITDLGRYRNIEAKLHGDETTLVLDQLTADSRDGHARVTAKAQHQKEGGYAVHAQANLQRFPLYAQGQNVANVGVDLVADATWRPEKVTAKVHVDEAHVELTDAKRKELQPLERPGDIVLLDGGAPVDEAEERRLARLTAAWKAAARDAAGDDEEEGDDAADADADADAGEAGPTRNAELDVSAPRNLWVKGKDANLELGLGNDFRVVSGRETRVLGEVFVRRGRVDILGRRFDLRRDSTLQFVGDPRDPVLDVGATHTNDKENVTVVVTAKGPLHAPKIAVTSPEHPELTETQLYTLIVTGRLELGGNSAGSASPSTQAASLLGGVVASQLQKALSKKLPLDVLTIESGAGLTGSRLEAGTYLSDKAYVGYVGRVGADPALLQNRNAVHLEYQLSRRWSFDGEYGDVGTGTADLMWTKHY